MLPRSPTPPNSASPVGSGAGSGGSNATADPNPRAPAETAPHPSLIILELELEHDMYNPLYPAPAEFLSRSGGGSPSSVMRSSASVGSGSGGGGTGSSSTPLAGNASGSDKTIKPNIITPPASAASVSSPSPGGTMRNGTNPSDDPRPILERVDEHGEPADGSSPETSRLSSSVTPRQSDSIDGQPGDMTQRGQLHMGGPGDTGEDESSWGPTAEQLLASTTSKSQPIRALERMRQAERTASQRRLAYLQRGGHPGGGAHRGSGRHPHRSGRLAYGGSGSLDVFSVLGQVNEQLSSANDLQTFLDVVVGIIKDLTQFHRVLIYQFDDSSNGQVIFFSAAIASCV